MIYKKPSKITKSLVNTAYEDHYNASKAIKDDAPITDNTSVISSINFNVENDGALALRKPLVVKDFIKVNVTEDITDSKYILHNSEDFIVVRHDASNNTYSLKISNGTSNYKVLLKAYDTSLKSVEKYMSAEDGFFNITWISKIHQVFTTLDHTIIPVKLNTILLNTYLEANVVTDTSILENVDRFLKIYKHEDIENTYVLEIIHPEFNSITSALDMYNAETLDINLLQDNPYAVRDLYGYGNVSCTKILPYVFKYDDSQITKEEIHNLKIYELTETGHLSNSKLATDILISTNPKIFNKNFLILKAFLTTTVTLSDYYCCWEFSKDDGVTWEVHPELSNRFETTEIKVSDLTSAEFDEILKKESLEKTTSYLVSKNVVPLNLEFEDLSIEDTLASRPDVLILENPNLSYKYRFSIYLKTNKPMPEVKDVTQTIMKASFADPIEGTFDIEGKIKYKTTKQNSEKEPEVNDGRLILYESSQVFTGTDGDIAIYQYGLGNALTVYTDEEGYKLKNVTVTLSPKRFEESVPPVIDEEKGLYELSIANVLANYKTGDEVYYKGRFYEAVTVHHPETNEVVYAIKLYDIGDDADHDPMMVVLFNKWNMSTSKGSLWKVKGIFKPKILESDGPGQGTGIPDTWGVIDAESVEVTTDITSEHKVIEEGYDKYSYKGSAIGVIGKYPENLPNVIGFPRDNPYKVKEFESIRVAYPKDTTTYAASTADFTYNENIPVVQPIIPPISSDRNEIVVTPDINVPGLGGDAVPVQLRYYIVPNVTNLWQAQQTSKTYNVQSYDESGKCFTLVNLTRCLEDYSVEYNEATKEITINYLRDDLKEVADTTRIEECRLSISSITVTYAVKSNIEFTDTYLVSTTGNFSVPYSNTTELPKSLVQERNRIFNGNFYYNENQMQLLIYKDNYVYSSGTNSTIIKLLNSLSLPEKITKIVPWRDYLLIFTGRAIYLSRYDSSTDGYTIKVLNNTVGVATQDANTIVPILNSIYFKSGTKVYKLVPNLYAATDDNLNIQPISSGIGNILEDLLIHYTESHNFGYTDSNTYQVFIPLKSLGKTYCMVYEITSKMWTLLEYPTLLTEVAKFSATEAYVKDSNNMYYFTESLTTLIAKGISENEYDSKLESPLCQAIVYGDYLKHTPKTLVYETVTTSNRPEYTPIYFKIDFGQKSSNYTLPKQFVETKITLATVSSKDNFPISLDILTDGVSRNLHWDATTDGALWKTSENSIGVLNTGFNVENMDYSGIFRQLIVKYSGKGKSIRHIISGNAISEFKFYSMDVRYRVLPNKH